MENVYVVQYGIKDEYHLVEDDGGTYVFASLDGAKERFHVIRKRLEYEYGDVDGAELVSDYSLYEVNLPDELIHVYVSLKEMEVLP